MWGHAKLLAQRKKALLYESEVEWFAFLALEGLEEQLFVTRN